MSMEKITNEVLIEESSSNSKEEQNESQNLSVSDGEIIDSDQEDIKSSPITLPLRKLQKNFRARHSDHSDESDDEGLILETKSGKNADKSSKETQKLNAQIENGDEKYLQNVRKKIISELKDKDSAKRNKNDRHFRSSERRSSHHDDSFRRNRFQHADRNMRPPPIPHNSSFRKFQRNSFHERRENGKIMTDLFEVRGKGKFPVFFPKSSIKYTKATPSLSYAENPKVKHSLKEKDKKRDSSTKSDDSRRSSISKSSEMKDPKDKHEKSRDKSKKKEKRRSRSKHRRSKSPKKLCDSSTLKSLPKPNSDENDKAAEDVEKETSIKAEEQEVTTTPSQTPKTNQLVLESPSYSPLVLEDTTPSPPPPTEPENNSSWKLKEENHTPEYQPEERMKFEPIVIEKKKIRKIEKPKVNIFLEDSDEVDEFENSVVPMEVKSKWSSPDPPPKDPDEFEDDENQSSQNVPKITQETKIEIPTVVDSPEKSPITTGSLTDSIFDTPTISSLSKSSTPQIKNVCSFLSDIESEGYLSSLSLGTGIYSDADDEDDDLIPGKGDTPSTLFSLNQEPDTTVDKLDVCILPLDGKENSDTESDCEDSESNSSSSSSSSSSESSEESSDESTDDETSKIVNIFSGFGRFDATTMPMVTQIKQLVPQNSTSTTETTTTTTTTRFQPHQSIIRPPGLITNLTKPLLYTPTPTISTPTTPFAMPTIPSFGQSQFPIPFKIYSLKDAGNNGMIFPSMQPPTTPVVVEKDKEKEREREKEKEKEREREKDREREKEKERDRDREREREQREKEREKEREKRPEKREREKHRSRSHSRERDRKKIKEDRSRDHDRRKTPPKRRTPSPKRRSPSPKRRSPSPRRRSISPRRKHADDKRDNKRRDFSPKHRLSHNSRHSPVRRNRRSRTPPSRGRTPPPKIRRISPISKYRRSSSPSYSPSPIYRRSPRRRYSPSPINEQTHLRRTPSPNDYERYDRRSYSPSFRKMESPSGYKPDSTISDTELERQQQFSQIGDYYNSWNTSMMPPHSPRPNLDDRINRMLSDSPTPGSSQYPPPPDASYPYPHPQIHDNSAYLQHHGFYYSEPYPPQNQSFIPTHTNMDGGRYQQHQPPQMMNNQPYEENFNSFASPRNFVNNSNLVEITQQKREKQRVGSNQIAVQVGNVLEIVPTTKMPSPPSPVKASPVVKPLSPEEMRQQAEKKEQMKNRRKAERDRKRLVKHQRKEKLRHEIQKYFDAGINIEDSDDETLIKLRPINVNAVAERGIIKKSTTEEQQLTVPTGAAVPKEPKKVLFKDGIMPGETSSDNDMTNETVLEKKGKIKRKRMRKQRLNQLIKERKKRPTNEMQIIVQKQDQLDTAPPPPPPNSMPPPHLKQPRLKKITPDMFAAFAINVEPIYYSLHKMQMMQNEHNFQLQPRNPPPNQYRYQKYSNEHYKHPNNNMQYPPNYSHQRYCGPSKHMNSMDPRINQQRMAEKTFA